VLHPLPLVPIMVCYWLPDEGMQSSLNLFFDETANENLDSGAVFALGSGLAQMLTKLAQRHG
jgi:dipeptide/tripeptide permease